MKVKIFSRPWSRELGSELEYEINEFLALLPASTVKHMDADIEATAEAAAGLDIPERLPKIRA